MRKRQLDIPMLGVIFSLAWPTMLQELMQTAVQYIDTAMAGSLGTQATAAVGATGTVSWLVNGTVSALGVGFLAYLPRPWARESRSGPNGPLPSLPSWRSSSVPS